MDCSDGTDESNDQCNGKKHKSIAPFITWSDQMNLIIMYLNNFVTLEMNSS